MERRRESGQRVEAEGDVVKMEEDAEEEAEHSSDQIITNKHSVAEENKAKRCRRCLLGCGSRCLLTQPRQNVQEIFSDLLLFFFFIGERVCGVKHCEENNISPLLN